MSGAGKTIPAKKLTIKLIESLKPDHQPYRLPDLMCSGLAIRIAPSGLMTWDLAYRISGTGKTKRISLGSSNDISLQAARERANEITKAARAGRDLVTEEEQHRKQADARISVEKLIEEYLYRRVEGRLRSAIEIRRRLYRALAPLVTRKASEVKRRDIRQLLDGVADRGLMREAERRRQIIGAMFRWALSQDIVEADPTAGLASYGTAALRDRILSNKEIRDLWKGLVTAKFPEATADVIRLQLALGARCGEVGGMRVEEIDQEQWLWTLPSERSKNKRARVTPLVGIAREIVVRRLSEVKTGSLFRTEIGNAITAAHVGHKLMNRQKKLEIAHFSTHDLRRTCATKFIEMGVPADLVASTLGHEARGGVEVRTLFRHYVRTDLIPRKKVVLKAWSDHLMAIVNGNDRPKNIHELTPAYSVNLTTDEASERRSVFRN